MTLIRNNPRSKYVRRISAAERLEKIATGYAKLLMENPAPEFTINGKVLTRAEITAKIAKATGELKVLWGRIAKPGNSSTKKNRTNTSWRSA